MFTVSVIGKTWAGYNTACEYHFTTMPDDKQVKFTAGDFQTVDDWQCAADLF